MMLFLLSRSIMSSRIISLSLRLVDDLPMDRSLAHEDRLRHDPGHHGEERTHHWTGRTVGGRADDQSGRGQGHAGASSGVHGSGPGE